MVVRSQQHDLVPLPAEDHVEVVEDVAAEDAQVGGRGVREGSKLPADVSWPAVVPGQLQDRPDQDDPAHTANPLQGTAARGRVGGEAELGKEIGTEDRAVGTAIDQ